MEGLPELLEQPVEEEAKFILSKKENPDLKSNAFTHLTTQMSSKHENMTDEGIINIKVDN